MGVTLAGVTLIFAGAKVGSFVIPEIPAYYVHTSVSLIALLAMIVAQIFTSQAVKGSDLEVRVRYGRYSILGGIVSIILLVVFLPTSFGSYQGLTERMFIAVQIIWIEVMALKPRSMANLRNPRP
jgi:hypothetical protein